MRIFIRGSSFILLAGVLGGCGSSKPASLDAAQAGKVVETKAVMQAGGTNVLRLTTSADMKAEAGDGTLKFTGAHELQIEYWLVRGAKTVDEAMARVDTQIVDEFKDFKPDHTSDLTIAGSPAKRLTGRGHEADDGDKGEADLIVFQVGGRVFVACTHGESLSDAGRQILLTTTETAQVP